MTDEQLIERIRTGLRDEVRGLHPAADLLDRVRSAPTRPGRLAFRLPSGVGGAVALLASAAVVAAVVVAFASLGHGVSSPTSGSSVPAGTPAGARRLVAQMAVLRRPQTAPDRLPFAVRAQLRAGPFRFPIIPSLTRLAATVDAGAGPMAAVGIYVVVARPPAAPVDIVTTVAVAGRPGHRYLLGTPEVVDGQTAIATGGLTGGAVGSAGNLEGTGGVNAGVVPDGVTRVKWVFGGDPGFVRKCRGRARCGSASPSVTVYPKVQNNVAVSRAAGLGVSSAIWYGPGGRVIASYNQAAQQRARAALALAASARQPIAPALIEHFAIFRTPVKPPATIRQLPQSAAVQIAQMGYGLNITKARFVPYPGTTGLWVIPGARGVSMFWPARNGAGGGGNVPVSMALSRGQTLSSCCVSGRQALWGLVPDSSRTVTVVFADGATRSVPVIDNVWATAIHGRAISVIAKDAAGRQITVKAPG